MIEKTGNNDLPLSSIILMSEISEEMRALVNDFFHHYVDEWQYGKIYEGEEISFADLDKQKLTALYGDLGMAIAYNTGIVDFLRAPLLVDGFGNDHASRSSQIEFLTRWARSNYGEEIAAIIENKLMLTKMAFNLINGVYQPAILLLDDNNVSEKCRSLAAQFIRDLPMGDLFSADASEFKRQYDVMGDEQKLEMANRITEVCREFVKNFMNN